MTAILGIGPECGIFHALAITRDAVVVHATSVVALTHRSEVSATEDVAHHIAAVDSDVSVAKHLACGDAIDSGVV